ncbi:DUF2244 domain-containing protein [Nevskia sp.]|uniref:DUF2244 domain-containing protein n=1 Tax=Nevskia sp. TaxID=1929292 RepID=UPI003F728E41
MHDTRLVIGPNASMTVKVAWAVMAVMAFVSLGIAVLFTLQGFWPILPFAGLELVALGLALYVSLKRNRYREVIAFEGNRVRIECGMGGEGARLSIDWPRSSTRVLLEQGIHRNDPTRLCLYNGSRRLILGRCLTDEDREQLAARLRVLVLAGWRVAPLAEADDMAPDGN